MFGWNIRFWAKICNKKEEALGESLFFDLFRCLKLITGSGA